MLIILIFFGLFFFSGLISFIFAYKHLLSMLLRLEFMILSLFLFLFRYLNLFNYEQYFRIYFLTFVVCEGVLGLSVLVSLIRSHGNDYLISFIILQC